MRVKFAHLPPDHAHLPPDEWRLLLYHWLASESCRIARHGTLLHDRICWDLSLRHHGRLTSRHPSYHWAGLNRLARLTLVLIRDALILLLWKRLTWGVCATAPREKSSTNSQYFDEPMTPHNRYLTANIPSFQIPPTRVAESLKLCLQQFPMGRKTENS